MQKILTCCLHRSVLYVLKTSGSDHANYALFGSPSVYNWRLYPGIFVGLQPILTQPNAGDMAVCLRTEIHEKIH